VKRSEALQIIEENLSSYHPISSSDFESISKNILQSLEEFGMLPPRAKLGTLGIEDNAWENEDE
jgi:hypothetical protein